MDGEALFDQRITAGWARDGHGDLLADDIYCLDDGPRILDCLEFDERLRVGDVLADAAFLAMDLERLGRPDLGWSFLRLHAELLDDHWPPSLAHHHIAYRAQVRAKVACARARQGQPDAENLAGRLLGIAAHHLDAGRVRLLLVGGAPGTGKSTIATALGTDLDAIVVRSDEVRKELAGLPTGAHVPAPPHAGIYDRSRTAATYTALLDRAQRLARARPQRRPRRDVADGSVATRRRGARRLDGSRPRDAALRRAARCGRGAHRGTARAATDPSDADESVAAMLAATFEPWPGALQVPTDGELRDERRVGPTGAAERRRPDAVRAASARRRRWRRMARVVTRGSRRARRLRLVRAPTCARQRVADARRRQRTATHAHVTRRVARAVPQTTSRNPAAPTAGASTISPATMVTTPIHAATPPATTGRFAPIHRPVRGHRPPGTGVASIPCNAANVARSSSLRRTSGSRMVHPAAPHRHIVRRLPGMRRQGPKTRPGRGSREAGRWSLVLAGPGSPCLTT